MKLPFTQNSILKLKGKKFSLGCKAVNGSKVSRLKDFSFDDEDKWRVENGVIYLLDDRESVTHSINAIEIEGGTVFMSGEDMGAHGKSHAVRTVLYEKKEIGENTFILISSHVDYEEKTLPRLIRSLAREGINPARIYVCVAGAEAGAPEMKDGYTRIPVEENFMGCTALYSLLFNWKLSALPVFDYILLLHDTCEVTPGFADKIASTDIGLPYDIIEGKFELGLWSKSFIGMLRGLDGFKFDNISGYEIYNFVKDFSRLYRKCSEPVQLRSKDVYGTGTKRMVLELQDLAVKKYAGVKKTGGRP